MDPGHYCLAALCYAALKYGDLAATWIWKPPFLLRFGWNKKKQVIQGLTVFPKMSIGDFILLKSI